MRANKKSFQDLPTQVGFFEGNIFGLKKMKLQILLTLGLFVAGLLGQVEKRLSPVLDCYINDGVDCTAYFGYLNSHESMLNVSVGSQNKFTPEPQDRGQLVEFLPVSRVYRAFNVTRPCNQGNLVWTLTDPNTGLTRTSTATNSTGNTCYQAPSCTSNLDCPLDYFCNGTCVGIQGAFCNSTVICADSYICLNNKCTFNATNSFPEPSEAKTCSIAPRLSCGSTVSIPLRESNVLSFPLTCTGDGATTYPANTTIALFYMPATNASFDTLSSTFTVNSPQVKVHVITECTSSYCNRLLSGSQISPGVWRYNHLYDYNSIGVVRGYAFIIPNPVKFSGPQGVVVNATVNCLKIGTTPISPPVAAPVRPNPPPYYGCTSDASCACGYCCSKEALFTCVPCPTTCIGSFQCTANKPYCAANGRCTSVSTCPAFVPVPQAFTPRAPPPTLPPPIKP